LKTIYQKIVDRHYVGDQDCKWGGVFFSSVLNEISPPIEPIIFDVCPWKVMDPHVANGSVKAKVTFMPEQKLPCMNTWIEFPLDMFDVSEDEKFTQRFALLCYYYEAEHIPKPGLVACMSCVTEDAEGYVRYLFTRMYFENGSVEDVTNPVAPYDEELLKRTLYTMEVSLFWGCFLLETPKAVELVQHKWDLKLQERRVKRGKHPLHEFKRVKVLVGPAATIRRSGQKSEPTGHHGVRLHSVMGHFRDLPALNKMAWVKPHWRGDAKLGVISKERDVVYIPDS